MWLIYGIASAAVLAAMAAYTKLNPFQQSIWSILLYWLIPIALANAAIMKFYREADSFTVAYFIFIGIYAAAGYLCGMLLFHETSTLLKCVALSLIIAGVLLLQF